MRHLQLYESFGEHHKVAVYDNFPEYRELKLSKISEDMANSGVQWFREDDFKWQRRQFPVYIVDNTWEFYDNLDKPPVNWPESKPPIKVVKLDRNGNTPLNQKSLEDALGCSYKELIDIAKSPEEVMADELEEDPTLLDLYSRRRPLVYSKASEILKSRGTLPSEEKASKFARWKAIQKWI
jgi:hypothetical protein